MYRMRALLLIPVLALTGSGCARLFGSYDVAPSGLARNEHQLRQMLVSGQADQAFSGFGTESTRAPDDDVLRALYRGVLAYYAGRFEESAAVLDTAGYIADDRVTKSLSRSAFSLISNDNVLPYEPGRTERLLIPYYGALARVRMGDMSGAAVEARRLSFLLQRYQDEGKSVDPALAATLRFVAGALFEANGDVADADVAYRNAFALDSALVAPADSMVDDNGTVLVVLEQGFVAHRVEQGLAVMLLPEEIDAITDGDNRAAAAAFVAARIVQRAAHEASWYDRPYRRGGTMYVPAPDRRDLPYQPKPRMKCRKVEEKSDSSSNGNGTSEKNEKRECHEVQSAPYVLKVAWPVYRTDSRALDAFLYAAADTVSFGNVADVSRGVVADFDDERTLIIARTIARGTAKLALAKSAENSLEEKNETAARIVGVLGNLGSVMTERADTRSWHLLPGGITIARVRLAPGAHQLTVDLGGRTIALDSVTVRAGGMTVVPIRAW